MTRLVVDTDVYSFILKNSSEAQRFNETLRGCQIVLSFQTVAELFKWAFYNAWGAERTTNLENSFHQCIIAPYDRQMAWEWARVSGGCEKKGRRISEADAWIAATAIRYQIPLLTNNRKHFEAAGEYCGLKIVDVPVKK